MLELYRRDFREPPALEEVLQAAMHWHFDPHTGSKFWLEQKQNFSFCPETDVKTRQDLSLFPDVGAAWREARVEDLIPRHWRDQQQCFSVFESGGATGRPKRIIERESRRRGVEWVSRVLDQHDFPRSNGHWLHIGPTGPHIVGRSMGFCAELRGALCFYIDFDPRWVRRCLHAGRAEEARHYAAHIVEQALDVIRTEHVSVLFATPPILEAICAQADALAVCQDKLRGILWAGTSISPETARLLEDEFFPRAKIVGLYGNTMMGIAPQRPASGADEPRCVFQPFDPFCLIDVVDPQDERELVEYGSCGRIRTTLLTPEVFLPNNVERDMGRRVRPSPGFAWDGVAEICPMATGSVIEGVY